MKVGGVIVPYNMMSCKCGLEFWNWPTSETLHTRSKLMSSLACLSYVVGGVASSWDELIHRLLHFIF